MSYPSIITQPGSALRNVDPITEALAKLIDGASGALTHERLDSDTAGPSRLGPRRILEIGSGDCTHLKHWADRWRGVEWWPTGRNEEEVRTIDGKVAEHKTELANIHKGLELDIGMQDSWAEWESAVRGSAVGPTGDGQAGLFEGVLMINIIHCCPVEYPEEVFRHLSTETDSDQKLLLGPKGWIAAYSPFLADDGSYKSEGDAKFDREYIRSKDDSLGLRSIKSISEMAARWGFQEVARREMPKGNMWVVWSNASQA